MSRRKFHRLDILKAAYYDHAAMNERYAMPLLEMETLISHHFLNEYTCRNLSDGCRIFEKGKMWRTQNGY